MAQQVARFSGDLARITADSSTVLEVAGIAVAVVGVVGVLTLQPELAVPALAAGDALLDGSKALGGASLALDGVQTEATVVEVRRGPVGTGDVPSYFGAVSEAKTGKPSLIVDFLYRGITHEYGNFHAAPPSGCLGAVALVVVVILATICAVMVVVQP